MRQWLLKQRQKPKHVRDNIAFGFASGAALLVLVGWVVLIPKNDIFHSNVAADESPEAFSTFFDQIKEQVAGVRGSLDEQASSTQTTVSSPVFGATATTSSNQGFGTATSSTGVKEAVIFVVPNASTTVSTSTPPTTY